MSQFTENWNDIKNLSGSDYLNLKNLIADLDHILKEELEVIENIIEEQLEKKGSIHEAASLMKKAIAARVYGNNYENMLDNYHIIQQGLTNNRGTERKLRGLLTHIVDKKLEFDIIKDESNIKDLKNPLTEAVNDWVKSLVESSSADIINQFVHDEKYFDGDWQAFFDGMSLYILSILCSGAFLKRYERGFENSKKASNMIKIASRIYYNNELTLKQYRDLNEADIKGAIVFRGMAMTPGDAESFLDQGKSSKPGRSWSVDYSVAVKFGTQQMSEKTTLQILQRSQNHLIKSVEHMKAKLYDRWENSGFGLLKALCVDPGVAHDCLSWIRNANKHKNALEDFTPVIPSTGTADEDGKTVQNESAMVTIILSYDIAQEDTFLNLGSESVDRFLKQGLLENEEIVAELPDGLELNKHSVDVIFPVSLKKSEITLEAVDTDLDTQTFNQIIELLYNQGEEELVEWLRKRNSSSGWRDWVPLAMSSNGLRGKLTLKNLKEKLQDEGKGEIIGQLYQNGIL